MTSSETAEALRALRDKWLKEQRLRDGDYYDNGAYGDCADELDTLLAQLPSASPETQETEAHGWQFTLIADILEEYDHSEPCEHCAPLVMCNFHSVLSLLARRTVTRQQLARDVARHAPSSPTATGDTQ